VRVVVVYCSQPLALVLTRFFAFMLDGHGWGSGAADLIAPEFLWIPALLTPLCCYLVVRNRRWVSYTIGMAALPAALVFGHLFFKTLQYDLRDYPGEQLAIALGGALFPFVAIGVVYLLRCRWPRSSKALGSAGEQSSGRCDRAGLSSPDSPQSTHPFRYRTADDLLSETSVGAKSLLVGLTAVSWLLIFCAAVIVTASALVAPASGSDLLMESEGAMWCFLGALFSSATGSIAWLFGVRRKFKKKHRWARRCAVATYVAFPIVLTFSHIGYWLEEHVLVLPFILAGVFGAILAGVVISVRRRMVGFRRNGWRQPSSTRRITR
jgi:hypothetical protein